MNSDSPGEIKTSEKFYVRDRPFNSGGGGGGGGGGG